MFLFFELFFSNQYHCFKLTAKAENKFTLENQIKFEIQ